MWMRKLKEKFPIFSRILVIPIISTMSYTRAFTFKILVILLILLSSIFLIPGLTVNIVWAKAKQPIAKPEGMDSWAGFFDPQIKVYATVTDANITLRPNDCAYIFPTFTLAYRAVCEAEENTEIIEADQQFAKCIESTSTPRKTQTVEFICARQMSVCGWAGIYGQALGCLHIPAAPPPPPFYEMLMPAINIKITPAKASTFFEPRIRAILSGATSGGKKQALLHDIEKAGPTISTVNYINKDYQFSTQIRGDKICGSYKSDLAGNIENCFLQPGMPKPKIIKDNTAQSRAINFTRDTEKGTQQIILREGEIENISKISVLAPEIDYKTRRFNGEFICKSLDIEKGQDKPACSDNSVPKYNFEEKDSAKRLLTCGNQPQNCGEGYQLRLQYKTAKNSSSNVLCLNGWEPAPAEYLLTVKEKTQQFKEAEYAFVPYKLIGEEWKKNKNSGNLSIKTSAQELLDTADNIGQGIYAFSNGSQTYRYERPVYTNSQGVETPFISLNKEVPFYLPADEGENKYSENICGQTLCYTAIDPYLQGLCVFIKPIKQVTCFNSPAKEDQAQATEVKCRLEMVNVPSLGIDEIPPKPEPKGSKEKPGYGDYGLNIKETFDCDFLTLEAIGGGASGNIPTAGVVDNIFSGSSGAYTSATIKGSLLKNYQSIAVFIGKGGEAATGNIKGQESKIYLCTEKVKKASAENCELLLRAAGGSKDRQVAENNEETAFGKDFKDKFLYQKNTAGIKGCLSRQNRDNPLVPVPEARGHAIDTSDSYCAPGENYKSYSETDCAQNGQEQKENIISGQGGCVSETEGIIKDGHSGMVRIICEKW